MQVKHLLFLLFFVANTSKGDIQPRHLGETKRAGQKKGLSPRLQDSYAEELLAILKREVSLLNIPPRLRISA